MMPLCSTPTRGGGECSSDSSHGQKCRPLSPKSHDAIHVQLHHTMVECMFVISEHCRWCRDVICIVSYFVFNGRDFSRARQPKNKMRITHAKHHTHTHNHFAQCCNMIELGLCEFGASLMIFTSATNLRTYRFRSLVLRAGTNITIRQSMLTMHTSVSDSEQAAVCGYVCSCMRNAAKTCFA